ncbi:glycosyltransferase family 2 protein [Bacteroides sp.]|uniref:glycosyltransferase family 2 protein n=1 Tax=Bacteroides sp. TaxID=29523 RepID=UPI0026220218|nr:glycosyltransferase family 2 protein [Bacteroides sp.]MDD3038174.1 glycosyltransferase family 2 protein [Bacteroides sp.]
MKDIIYSVIIPHKNSLETLPRLINSIPRRDDIEIFIIDNSVKGISLDDIKINRDLIVLHSNPEKFAGGARNTGIDKAKGEWLIFADSDDFFTEKAFDIFDKYHKDNADLIYFKSNSVYDDTLEQCDRHIPFVNAIDNYISNSISSIKFKLSIVVPWAKMVRKSFILKYNIRYDEVLAANDVMFSVKSGYYAQSFIVSSGTVYVVTMRRGSLSQRWDYPVIKSRYLVCLNKNQFLKERGLGIYQSSVMIYLVKSFSYGINVFWEFVKQAICYRQNIFIGWKDWPKSLFVLKNNYKKNKKYIVN